MAEKKLTRERYWAKVKRRGMFECWPWLGSLNGAGYGSFNGEMAHRVGYQELFGPIPPGKVLDHLCRNRWCQNPHCLEVVSSAENKRRGFGARTLGRRKNAAHCHRGHLLSGENLYLVVDKDGRKHRKCRACRRMAREESLAGRRAALSGSPGSAG